MRALVRRLMIASACLGAFGSAHAERPLADALAHAAPRANAKAIRLAVEAADCATLRDGRSARHLAVIDYSLPSTLPRLWVFDLDSRELVFEELVAHGRNSGETYARAFSNRPDSLTSSLGLFRTQDAYLGDNGYSLRLSGLEPGVNDHAESRAIVMHGAAYVDRAFIKATGRLGRSHGCPAVRPAIAQSMIDTLKGGQYLFAYYPDATWLKTSAYFGCTTATPRKPASPEWPAGAMTQAASGVESAIR